MIQLTVIDGQGSARLVATEPLFRINGAAIWLPERVTYAVPLVHYASGSWYYDARQWTGVRFEGPCRLVFGFPRDPPNVSDVLTGISIHNTTLTANGLPFAVYEPDRDVWHGTGKSWWHAFRVEHVDVRGTHGASKDSQPGSQDSDPTYRGAH